MSKSPLTWKFALILAVVGLAAFFSYPPQDKINLGLDLRGGTHVLMQVDTESALEHETDLTQDRVGQGLKEAKLAYGSIKPVDITTLEIRGTNPAARAEVAEVISTRAGIWDLEGIGPGAWRLGMPQNVRGVIEKDAIDTTLSRMRERIDTLGVSEPLLHKQGIRGDRILAQLPGVEDPEMVKILLTEQGLLEWKAVTYPPQVTDFANWGPPDSKEATIALFGGQVPDDTELIRQSIVGADGTKVEYWWPLKRVSAVAGSDLRSAFPDVDEFYQPSVSFQLTEDAGRRFLAATRENRRRRMAIVLENNVISAPVIEDEIRDRGIIRGGFSETEAAALALKLRSGALPAKVSIIEERTVGPSLGRDSIRRGLTAGSAGFLGVILFMVVYYRLSGVNAVVALTLNMLLVFGTLGALPFLFSGGQATLTLPGIAGLILTVGMAVDSNVLIFERIREELRVGKTVRSAVEQGFGKAFTTILDCNVTTLVAAFFLFSYGTGPVKGFAVTLTIGLLASMFTAVFVSRQIFELVLRTKGRDDSLSI